MELDAIGYGNPTIENLKGINSESYLDSLFAELTQFTFPKNSSEATREELATILKHQVVELETYIFFRVGGNHRYSTVDHFHLLEK